MAVVSNVAVINLLSDNGLLAPSYSKEKALSDLSSSLIGTRTFDDEDINETIKLLPTMTSAKIKNASDLNAVVSLNKDEIIERSELYKSYDEKENCITASIRDAHSTRRMRQKKQRTACR